MDPDQDEPATPHEEFRETLRILREDPAGAVGRLRGRITAGTADYRTWHNLAVALANSGDRVGALEAVRTALDTSPDSAVSHFLLGMLLREEDHHEKALEAFERVQALDPGFRRLHANLGVVRFFLEDSEQALEDLETAVRRDPADTSALFNLAVVNVTLKRFSAAQRIFQRLIDLERDRAGYYQQFLVELGRVQVIEETLTQAHRIKNFMGIVGDRLRSFCETSLDGLGDEESEDLSGIREDYERIYGDLVVFLRAIRPRPMRLERVSLRRLVECVVFVATDKAGGIPVRREIPEDLPDITCDIELIQEAFLNLVLNAFDAVTSRHGERAAESGEVRLDAEVVSEGIAVSFSDNGAGIPSGELARVFKFGFTTKSLGTGIGLSFTRKIIEDHGGRIDVDSEEGNGTTMRCTLPVRPRISESLANLAIRSQLFHDPRELILEEKEEDLGI